MTKMSDEAKAAAKAKRAATKELRKDNILAAAKKLAELRKEGAAGYQINAIKRLSERPTNHKRAVNAQCFTCQGGTIDSLPSPGWQRRISFCTKTDCPLYWVRPYRGKFDYSAKDDDEGGEA